MPCYIIGIFILMVASSSSLPTTVDGFIFVLNCCYKDNKLIYNTIEIGPKQGNNLDFGPISKDGKPTNCLAGNSEAKLSTRSNCLQF